MICKTCLFLVQSSPWYNFDGFDYSFFLKKIAKRAVDALGTKVVVYFLRIKKTFDRISLVFTS